MAVIVFAMCVRGSRCAIGASGSSSGALIGNGRIARRRRGAALTVDPTGVAVLVVLLLPDGHTMFDFVDDVSTRLKCFCAVAGADAYPNGHFPDSQVSDPVYARGVFDPEAFDGLCNDALAFFDRQRFECFVFQVT